MHLYDDGLVVGQFGVDAPYVGQWLPEAPAQMAGNAFSNAIVEAADGSRYIYQNDESWHGGVHRWHVTGLDTIHEDSIAITLANALESGLQGTYYNDASLSSLKAATTRVDPTVNVELDPSIGPSVRWQGFVQPRYTEAYTFYLHANDGVRLWVNNVLLIDQWTDQPPTEWSGTIKLEADKLYPVRLEYYQNDSAATAQMSWSSTSQAKEIVPTSRLFYTDVTPTSPGQLNIHEGLWYEAGVSDGLYGWHRTPAQDITNDWLNDFWKVDTSRYSYRRDRPADIRANFSRPGTASVTRELRNVGDSAVNGWTLGGLITFGANYNRNEYGDSTSDSSGQYLEVLDDAGKIIARLYPRALNLNVAPPVSINGNTGASSVKVVSSDTWNRTIWQTPNPFSISAAAGKLSFTFADGSITNVTPLDSAANWQKPTTLRIFYYHFHPNWGYGLEIGLSDVTFSTH
jgi:hypothetical protein